MSCTLEHADAFDYLETLPDSSIDALITDPPYGTTQLSWDKANDWSILWPLIYQKCKPSAVQVMFSAQPFTTDLIVSNRKRFRYELIWDKPSATGVLNANLRPLKVHENIVIFSEKPSITTYNPQMWRGKPKGTIRRSPLKSEHQSTKTGSVYINHGERYPVSIIAAGQGHGGVKPDHPTQKPLDLLIYLVKTYTNPGDTVLDLFTGSGTTAVACLETGRNFVGCEIDETYFSAATKRIAAVKAQGKLEFA